MASSAWSCTSAASKAPPMKRACGSSARSVASCGGAARVSATVTCAPQRVHQRAIASPGAALVDDVVRRPGEWVPASGTVVSLLPPAGIKVVFFVPEPQRATLHPETEIAVACTGCPPGLTARIARLAAEAEFTPPVIYSNETRSKLVFMVEARPAPADAAKLHPGQPVSVELK